METIRDLFAYDLSYALESERLIADTLPELADESDSEAVRTQLRRHEQETQRQIENLEQSFDLMGMDPYDVEPMVVGALRAEHEAFKEMEAPESLHAAFDLGSVAKTEHFEIAMYRGLVEKAGLLGETEIQQLLEQNLQQEERMAQQVEQMTATMGTELMRRAAV